MSVRLKRIHHVAYRCRDAKETVEFYQRVLDTSFSQLRRTRCRPRRSRTRTCTCSSMPGWKCPGLLRTAELPEISGRRPRPSGSSTLPRGGGSRCAVAGEGTHRGRGRRGSRPREPRHLRVDLLLRPQRTPDRTGREYRTATQLQRLHDVAPAMLQEWSETRRAPRHAAWLHV